MSGHGHGHVYVYVYVYDHDLSRLSRDYGCGSGLAVGNAVEEHGANSIE